MYLGVVPAEASAWLPCAVASWMAEADNACPGLPQPVDLCQQSLLAVAGRWLTYQQC